MSHHVLWFPLTAQSTDDPHINEDIFSSRSEKPRQITVLGEKQIRFDQQPVIVGFPPQLGVMLAGFLVVIVRSVVLQGGVLNIISDSHQGGRLNFQE